MELCAVEWRQSNIWQNGGSQISGREAAAQLDDAVLPRGPCPFGRRGVCGALLAAAGDAAGAPHSGLCERGRGVRRRAGRGPSRPLCGRCLRCRYAGMVPSLGCAVQAEQRADKRELPSRPTVQGRNGQTAAEKGEARADGGQQKETGPGERVDRTRTRGRALSSWRGTRRPSQYGRPGRVVSTRPLAGEPPLPHHTVPDVSQALRRAIPRRPPHP